MKHPQHIVAFDKTSFGIVAGPFTAMAVGELKKRMTDSLIIARRHELEGDERYAQALPYIALYRKTKAADVELFVYQRTAKVGESRLGGKFSCGVGGHVDLADVSFDEMSVIDPLVTIGTAMVREIREEIGFRHIEENSEVPEDQTWSILDVPRLLGVINDSSDAVGRVHYGLVFGIEVPEGFEPFCRESELVTHGFYSPHGDPSPGEFENWSEIVFSIRGLVQ